MATIRAPRLRPEDEDSEENTLPERLARRFNLFVWNAKNEDWDLEEEAATYGGCLQAAKGLHESLWAIVVEMDNGEPLTLAVNNPEGHSDLSFGESDESDPREETPDPTEED